jgi:hypothetical protein
VVFETTASAIPPTRLVSAPTVSDGRDILALGNSRVSHYSLAGRQRSGLVEDVMWKPWEWARVSNDRAVVNARAGSTALSRRRVEREDVELFLRRHDVPAAIRVRHAVGSAPRPA